jgi:hypothetical protein
MRMVLSLSGGGRENGVGDEVSHYCAVVAVDYMGMAESAAAGVSFGARRAFFTWSAQAI